jgi:hypothetical protein
LEAAPAPPIAAPAGPALGACAPPAQADAGARVYAATPLPPAAERAVRSLDELSSAQPLGP